jgi:Glycosyl hydrolase family 79 C-terminal beta domain
MYLRTSHADIYRLTAASFQIQPVTLTQSTLNESALSTPLPPHIQPQYYSAIIAAEAIGNSNNTQVVELHIHDTRISGYAFYQGGQLTKAILINSLAFLTTTTDARSSTNVKIIFTSDTFPSKMNVTRLSVPYVQLFESSIFR